MKQLIGFYTYIHIDGSSVELYGSVEGRKNALVAVYLIGDVLFITKCSLMRDSMIFMSSKFTLTVGDDDMLYKLHKGYGNK